ncbi:uncharacterized protein LOC141903872 isoform X2 [Tubulanus polymorphus]|uniref:uncharacterized protein LOC141903872 isoform X2 n=1 Tax=Tubulanus polymorphus TaxID=672921 RepID=UPI003DA30405
MFHQSHHHQHGAGGGDEECCNHHQIQLGNHILPAAAAGGMLQAPAADIRQFPSLIDAVSGGNAQEVMFMIMQNRGAINDKGWHGLTALHKATLRTDAKILQMLLHLNADVNCVNDFLETPLMFACRNGNIGFIHMLLERGADLNSVDKVNRGAVLHACVGGSVLTLHFLSTVCNLSLKVADINGMTPLHVLCSHGHLEAVKYILKNQRCDPMNQDEFGNTAMHYACKNGNSMNVWRLLEVAGNKAIHIKNNEGMTPIDYTRANNTPSNTALIQKIEPLLKSDRNSYPRGPVFLYYWKLLMSFVIFGCVVTGLQYVLSESQGLVMLLVVISLIYRIWTDGHRMTHMSQWACPSQLGGYFGGQLQLLLCFLIHILPIIYKQFLYPIVIPVIITAPIYLYLCLKIATQDPGFETRSAVKDHVSGEFTVRDIAIGLVPSERFCSECEIIQPVLTKHCRLCRKCVNNLDHHCLFFMRCIGDRNHCAFLYYTIVTIIAGFLFLGSVYAFATIKHPDNLLMSVFSLEGWIMGCVYLTVITLAMSLYVLKWQLNTISKGETWAFFSHAPVSGLTSGEEILNVFYFLTGRKYLKRDPMFDVENAKSVKMAD